MNPLHSGPSATSSSSTRWDKWSGRAAGIFTALFAVATCIIAMRPLFAKIPWVLFEEDDFFYYLKVAQNLSHGAGSTYNGIVPTNGYHPLWLLVLTAVTRLTEQPHAIFGFLACSVVAATLATYFLARKLVDPDRVGPLAASALAAYIALYSMSLFFDGMEVTLTIPLVLSVVLIAQRADLWQRNLLHSAVLGLLVSAMILSRLDTIILAGLLLVGLLLHTRLRGTITVPQIAGVSLGLVPLVLYFISNKIWFHVWIPVSGMAKQLKHNHLPSAPALHSVTTKSIATSIPILFAILLLPVIYKRLSDTQKAFFPSVLIYPFLYIAILSCLSDWHLWGWYFYPLRPALCVAFVVFAIWPPTGRLLSTPLCASLLALFMLSRVFLASWPTGGMQDMYEIGLDVRAFASTHPGVYAMGDRAGLVGYLLPQPLIQTEGLVMDREFLTYIQRQASLRSTLEHYGVRYYIATAYPPFSTSDLCIHAVEPAQAGPASSHLRDDFCEAPVAVFNQAEQRTLIFDLKGTAVRSK